ncbi:MAG: hypothetical protein QM802_09430 [Agriterribacter sp.]
MKKLWITTCIITCFCSSLLAQKKSSKLIFHSQEQVALINGNGAVSAGIQSVNGVAFNNWFAGVGAGLDFYRYRSVPLFADVKRYFRIANGNSFFVYGDGGYNFPWKKKNDQDFSQWSWPSKVDTDAKGGAYMDGGVGYAIKCRNGNALLLSAGYSHKYFSEKVTTIYEIGGIAGNIEQTDVKSYTYSFNRIMIKVGWQF